MHGLETSEQPSRLLEECWRVLGPGGKALFIVPNRAGLWSRSDRTPFGYGRPYTLSQLETQLRRHQFLPDGHAAALYQPPSTRRFWLKSAPLFEKYGSHLPRAFPGGAFMVEATKRAQPPEGTVARDLAKAPIKALEGLAKPAGAMRTPSQNLRLAFPP
jgi:SAM-dependent methyltransferase